MIKPRPLTLITPSTRALKPYSPVAPSAEAGSNVRLQSVSDRPVTIHFQGPFIHPCQGQRRKIDKRIP
jgi:hypothetical protein